MNVDPTVQPKQGAGTDRSTRGSGRVATGVIASRRRQAREGDGAVASTGLAPADLLEAVGDAADGSTALERAGFGPPAPGSRVETIIGAPLVEADVVVECEALVEQPVMEQPVPEEPVEDERVAEEPVAESPSEPTDTGDDDPSDDAVQVGDDFWTGAASEDSIPTRKHVYGAHSEPEDSGRRGWIRSIRRRRH